jgi:hypothetical protein
MTQKKETTPMESKSVTKSEATPVKPETASVTKETESVSKPEKTGRGITGDLSPELIELVTELRDTVRRIDPRKHTEKTLHRVLVNVNDILKDIEALYIQS